MCITAFQEGPLKDLALFGPVLDAGGKPECSEKKPAEASLDWKPSARDRGSNPGLIQTIQC